MLQALDVEFGRNGLVAFQPLFYIGLFLSRIPPVQRKRIKGQVKVLAVRHQHFSVVLLHVIELYLLVLAIRIKMKLLEKGKWLVLLEPGSA